MPTHAECKRLALEYLQDAKVLYGAERYDSASYLCGYVLELALKARVCRHLKLEEYPPPENKNKPMFKTHDLDQLKLLGGLYDWPSQADAQLWMNWSLISGWRPEERYEPRGARGKADVEAKLKALTDTQHGILTWLKKKW